MRLLTLIFCFSASSLLSAACFAEQVAFGFEAEITEVTPVDSPLLLLPPDIFLGNKLSGVVEFIPPPFFGLDSDHATLHLSLESLFVEADETKLETIIDISPTPTRGIRIRAGMGLPGSIVSTPIDSTVVTSLDFLIFGPPGSIDSLFDAPGDVDVWNRLPSRFLLIDIASSDSSGSYRITAIPSLMTEVPEPTTLGSCVILFVISSLAYRTQVHQ